MTAIKATFSDFRIVKGRKVAQLVMEVPIEAANNALEALGGVPQPDVERWVGIARLTDEAATRPAEKPRKRFRDMPRSQQAGILCQDTTFAQFAKRIMVTKDYITENECPRIEDVSEFVRSHCGVTTRADLDRIGIAADKWDTLVTEYDSWRGKIAGEE